MNNNSTNISMYWCWRELEIRQFYVLVTTSGISSAVLENAATKCDERTSFRWSGRHLWVKVVALAIVTVQILFCKQSLLKLISAIISIIMKLFGYHYLFLFSVFISIFSFFFFSFLFLFYSISYFEYTVYFHFLFCTSLYSAHLHCFGASASYSAHLLVHWLCWVLVF